MKPSRRGSGVWLTLLLSLISCCAWAQSATPDIDEAGSELEVSLLTFGPGEIYWERFGHNAIAIRDRRSGEDWSFNYGIFDFAEANFFVNFLRGHMRYSMAANPLQDDIALYAQDGRSVQQQVLQLSPAQRLALRDYLAWNLRPENSRYRYEYFSSNCSTKVRDALDKALGGELQRQLSAPSRGATYRLRVDTLMAPDPALMLPMDLGLGPYADKRLSFWDESFIPMALAEHIASVSVAGANGERIPLVSSTRQLAAAEPHLTQADNAWLRRHGPYPLGYALPAGAIGTALGLSLLLLLRQRRHAVARYAFALLSVALTLSLALAGLAVAALWGLTQHISAWRNENLLLLNPLLLALLPSLWRARQRDWVVSAFAQRVSAIVLALALLTLALKVLPWFVQDNAVWLALLLPLHLSLAIALWRVATRAR